MDGGMERKRSAPSELEETIALGALNEFAGAVLEALPRGIRRDVVAAMERRADRLAHESSVTRLRGPDGSRQKAAIAEWLSRRAE